MEYKLQEIERQDCVVDGKIIGMIESTDDLIILTDKDRLVRVNVRNTYVPTLFELHNKYVEVDGYVYFYNGEHIIISLEMRIYDEKYVRFDGSYENVIVCKDEG